MTEQDTTDPPEEPCFMTWDEAVDKIAASLSAVIPQARKQADERFAESMLTALRRFLKDKDNAVLAQAINLWHEAKGYECCAHSEGQACCIDELLGSTEPSA